MSERARTLCLLGVAAVFFAGAFIALFAGGLTRAPVVVWSAGLLLAAAAILLQLALSRVRAAGMLPRPLRLFLPVAVAAAGLAIAVIAFRDKAEGAWVLFGATVTYLSVGQLLAEWRSSEGKWRGPLLCALFGSAFVAGVLLGVARDPKFLCLAAGALLLGPIGLTLFSEDVLRRLESPGRVVLRFALAIAGALAALLGVWLLINTAGVPNELAWPLAGGLLLLVGAIASSSQADVLVVVTVLVLAWTAVPAGVRAGKALRVEKGEPTLVALGDSYMSGEGAAEFLDGTNRAGKNECRRAPTAYSHRVVDFDRAEPITRLAFHACSGAVAANLYERPQFGTKQLDQLEADLDAGAELSVVIVSIGGNDARFSTIGMACLAPGSCVERGGEWLRRLDDVGEKAETAYWKVRDAVDDAVPVVAVPYPVPIRPRSCGHSLLDGDEHFFLHKYVEQLNGVLRQAALDAKVYYLEEMAAAFGDDLRICDGERDEAGVNFVALKSVNGLVDEALNPSKWIHNSLHPNERGHEAMASVLDAWLQAHPDAPPRPQGDDVPGPFAPLTLEQIMGPSVVYCGDPDPGAAQPDHCDRKDVAWTLTQVGIKIRDALPAAFVLVLGCWLLSLALLAWTRRRWRRLGACVTRELLGQPASSAAAAVQTASSTKTSSTPGA